MSAPTGALRRLLRSRRRARAAATASLADDLRALQLQVEQLRQHVHALETNQDEVRVRQVEEFDSIRLGITRVADDLSVRIAALHRSGRDVVQGST